MDYATLAAQLGTARRTGATVAEFVALDIPAGYKVAAALDLGRRIGWKVGATSAGAQAFLGVDEPIYGRLFAAWRDEIKLPGDRAAEAEPEILLEVGDDLMPSAAWFGIEINRPSFADPFVRGVGAIVADNAASCGIAIGPMLRLGALDDPAALVATIRLDGTEVARGSADAVLGNPRRAYDWLRGAVNLCPGDIVATGAMCRSVIVAHGQVLQLDAGPWGQASFTLK